MSVNGGRLRIIYFIIVSLLIIGYLTYSMRNIYNNHDGLILNQAIPHEYLSLLNLKDTSDVKIVINYTTKYRFPITLIDYKNKYTLIIYKICDSLEISLKKGIRFNNDYFSSLAKSNGTYTVVNEKNFEFYYHNDTAAKFHQIEVSLSGDSISEIIQSDSLVLYCLKFNQIAWTKNSNNILDIYIEPKNDLPPFSKKIPAAIAFMKRLNSLYFVLLSVNDNGSSFDKKMLWNLLVSDHQ